MTVAAFGFEDGELEVMQAAKAGMPRGGAIGLADLAAPRKSRTPEEDDGDFSGGAKLSIPKIAA